MKIKDPKHVEKLASLVGVVYVLFDIYLVFVPSYFDFWASTFLFIFPMIFLNCLGLVVYNKYGEELLDLEREGKDIVERHGGRWEWAKELIRENKALTFIFLSIWPCAICAYIFIRDAEKETYGKAFGIITIGCILCTLFWCILLELSWKFMWYTLLIIGIVAFIRRKALIEMCKFIIEKIKIWCLRALDGGGLCK